MTHHDSLGRMDATVLVEFIGSAASGKSTLARYIQAIAEAKGVRSRILPEAYEGAWKVPLSRFVHRDVLSGLRYLLAVRHADHEGLGLLLRTLLRADQLSASLGSQQFLLSDEGSLHGVWAMQLGHPLRTVALDRFLALLPAADWVVSVRCSPQVALDRLKGRSPGHRIFSKASVSALAHLQDQERVLDAIEAQVSARTKLMRVRSDTGGTPFQLASVIWQNIMYEQSITDEGST